MHRDYTESEINRILSQDLDSPDVIEEAIQGAYSQIREQAAAGQGESKVIRPEWKDMATDSRKGSDMKGNRKKTWRRRSFWPATAAVLVASTVTVMAMTGVFTRNVEEKGDALTYTFDVDYTLTTHAVKVTANYIPDGYHHYMEEEYKYTKDDSGRNGISIITDQADTLARDGGESLSISGNVESIEHTQINGMEADVITLSYDEEAVTKTFDKRIYLFDEMDGCVVEIYGGNDLSMDELIKVAEGIEITVSDEEVTVMSPEEIESEKDEEEALQSAWEEAQRAKQAAPISADIVYGIGDTFTWDGVELTVESAEILDSAADLDTANIFNYEEFARRLNEDGTAKEYTRITYEGNMNVPGELLGEETVGQKFLKVTVQASAANGANDDFWAGAPVLNWLTLQDDGTYQQAQMSDMYKSYEEYGYTYEHHPFWFDGSSTTTESSHFFYTTLEDGETKEYTLVYLVDEDRIENVALDFGTISSDSDAYEKYVLLDVE